MKGAIDELRPQSRIEQDDANLDLVERRSQSQKLAADQFTAHAALGPRAAPGKCGTWRSEFPAPSLALPPKSSRNAAPILWPDCRLRSTTGASCPQSAARTPPESRPGSRLRDRRQFRRGYGLGSQSLIGGG